MRRAQRRLEQEHSPFSLRDVQKSLHRLAQTREYNGPLIGAVESLSHLIDIPAGFRWLRSGEYVQPLISQVDRLAAKYGPKTLIRDLGREDEESSECEEIFQDLLEDQENNDSQGSGGGSNEVQGGRSSNSKDTADSRKVGDAQSPDHENSEKSGGNQSDQDSKRGQGTADHHGVTMESKRDAVAAAETGTSPTPQSETSVCKVQGPAVSEDAPGDSQQDPGDEADRVNHCHAGNIAVDPCSRGSAGKDATTTDRSTLVERDMDSEQLTDSTDEDNQSGDPKQIGEDEKASENTPQPQVSEEASPSSKQAMKSLKKLGTVAGTQSSRQGRNANGGITAELRQAKISLGLVAKVRSVLASWIADGGQDEQSSRWDYTALSGRLLTRRNPYPARKAELGRPVLLVLADVSGSCAGFSSQSLLVARGIASQGMPGCDVLVVSHSNGDPMECEVNGMPLPTAQLKRYKAAQTKTSRGDWHRFHEGNVAFYTAMIADYSITHVIALGDHDAVDVYTMLAEHAGVQQVLWLDNCRCNWQSPGLGRSGIASPAAHAKMRYVVGCKDADAFLVGLRKAIVS